MRSRFVRSSIVLLIICLVHGCGVASGSQELSFTSVAQGNILNRRTARQDIDKPALIIMASVAETETFLNQIVGNPPTIEASQEPINQLRQLDYNRFFVVLVYQGLQRSSGYSVTVRQVTRHDDRVSIKAEFVLRGTRGATHGFTDPYHLITVSKVGVWGQQFQFQLADGDNIRAETTHYVP